MDIPKWLQDTVDAGELSPTNRRDPRPIVAPTANAVEHQKRNSRKQKRSTNSSLIEPQRAHQHDAHDRRRPAATDTDHQGAKSGSSSSHSDRLSDDAESHQSEDNPYQRRKRRKTRPDRYDEKPAKTANRDKSKRNNDSRRKEGRRSRAKRKIASETMLVKDYKAKNVSAARLTVRLTTHLHATLADIPSSRQSRTLVSSRKVVRPLRLGLEEVSGICRLSTDRSRDLMLHSARPCILRDEISAEA